MATKKVKPKVKKRKPPKMDRLLLSAQPWELRLVAKVFQCSIQKVKDAKSKVGVSRISVYKELLDGMGD